MKRKHLTRTFVDGLRPLPKPTSGQGKSLVIWDDDPRALGVRVTPSGRVCYVVRMQTKGQQRWVTLGEHGQPAPPTAENLINETARTWSPEEARVAAKRLLGQVADGADPGEAKRLLRGAPTLAEAARAYIEDRKRFKRASTLDADCRLFGLEDLREKHRAIKDPKAKRAKRILDEPFAGRKLREISREDIEGMTKRWHSTPIRANRAVALLSHVFKVNRIEPNPCRGIERNEETKRRRYLDGTELARLGKVLNECDEDPRAVAAIRLLLFTGARRSEILTLEWERREGCAGFIDGDKATLLTSKTGAKTIVLPPAALAVLKSLKPKAGNAYVIAGEAEGKPLASIGHAWERIRTAAKLDGVRLHDLRHTSASFAISGGASLVMVGAMLGHTDTKTTERYAHLFDAPVRAVATSASDAIFAALKGTPGRVLPMKKRA